VFVSRRDHAFMRRFQPVEAMFKRLHRAAADVDDILAQLGFARRHQRPHQVAVRQDQRRVGQQPRADGVVQRVGHAPIFWPVLAQSALNRSSPLSVSTWLAIALMTEGGAVITSAPTRAHSITWLTERIEAASRLVS